MLDRPEDDVRSVFDSLVVKEKSPFDLDQLADRFRRSNTDWTIPEAFLGVLLSAAFADGEMQAAERDQILHIASRSRALNSISAAELSRINGVVNERLASRPTALQEACGTLPLDMGPSVFAHCVDLLLADGQLLPAEAAFLEELVTQLSVDQQVASQIMEALLIKAQY